LGAAYSYFRFRFIHSLPLALLYCSKTEHPPSGGGHVTA
jgi:hypothetical protein